MDQPENGGFWTTKKKLAVLIFFILLLAAIIGMSTRGESAEELQKQEDCLGLVDTKRFHFLVKSLDGYKIASVGKAKNDYREIYAFKSSEKISNFTFASDVPIFAYSVGEKGEAIEVLNISTNIIKPLTTPPLFKMKLSKDGMFLGILYSDPVMKLCVYDTNNFDLYFEQRVHNQDFLLVDFDISRGGKFIHLVLNMLSNRRTRIMVFRPDYEVERSLDIDVIVSSVSIVPGEDFQLASFSRLPEADISIYDVRSSMAPYGYTFNDENIDTMYLFYSEPFVYFFGKDKGVYLFNLSKPTLGRRRIQDDKGQFITAHL